MREGNNYKESSGERAGGFHSQLFCLDSKGVFRQKSHCLEGSQENEKDVSSVRLVHCKSISGALPGPSSGKLRASNKV